MEGLGGLWRADYYTRVFQGKGQNFPGVQLHFFGALQCSTMGLFALCSGAARTAEDQLTKQFFQVNEIPEWLGELIG